MFQYLLLRICSFSSSFVTADEEFLGFPLMQSLSGLLSRLVVNISFISGLFTELSRFLYKYVVLLKSKLCKRMKGLTCRRFMYTSRLFDRDAVMFPERPLNAGGRLGINGVCRPDCERSSAARISCGCETVIKVGASSYCQWFCECSAHQLLCQVGHRDLSAMRPPLLPTYTFRYSVCYWETQLSHTNTHTHTEAAVLAVGCCSWWISEKSSLIAPDRDVLQSCVFAEVHFDLCWKRRSYC